MKLLIKNGRVIDPVNKIDDTLDILVEKGKIIDIKSRIDLKGINTVDATRLVVVPGFIDMHVHLREPGQEHKETILTGTLAAARGGFTSLACMPNTSPVNDNGGITEYIIGQAEKAAGVNVFPVAAITLGLRGSQLSDMADLRNAGAVAFSDNGKPVFDSLIMRRALEYSRLLEVPVIDHCEDFSLSADGVMNESKWSIRFGLQGIPAAAEEIMVFRDIILAEKSGARIHIAHVSTKGSVELIRQAKKRKIAVTAEVTPHHLLLTDQMLFNYSTNLKVNPPLRGEDDRKALIQALQDGTIDAIATDHAPHTPDEKEVEFNQAPFGIIGLESAVPVLLDKLVHKNIISLERLVELLSSTPARILGLESKGRLTKGADADLTLLNLQKESVIDVNTFLSKSRNCPFNRWKLKGMPVMTIVGGKIIYRIKKNR
ncbi:MAG: dihydroorotase [Acidobacteriota bacterium]